MSSWQGIAEALVGALAVLWGVWTEIRLRNAQDDNAVLKRKLDDKKIEAETHAESDSELIAEANKFVSS